MLYKSGSTIKIIVKVIFTIYCILAVLVFAGTVFAAIETENVWMILAGTVAAPLIVFIAWLSSLVMYAYGELTESAVEINETLKEMKKLQQLPQNPGPREPQRCADEFTIADRSAHRENREPAPMREYAQPAMPVSEVEPAAEPAFHFPPAPPLATSDDWICPNCGKKLQKNHRFCAICGTPQPK